MKLICKIAAFIDSKHIEEVEKHILDIIKTLEYKKAAINMRHQAAASDANRDLNSSQFSISADEETLPEQPYKAEKTEIGSHMSKILAEFDSEDTDEEVKMKGNSRYIQPNR